MALPCLDCCASAALLEEAAPWSLTASEDLCDSLNVSVWLSAGDETDGSLMALSEAPSTGPVASPLLAVVEAARFLFTSLSRSSNAVCTFGTSRHVFRVVFLQSTTS